MSRFFDEDAEASMIARRFLREFSDEAIAWMPHLSSTHMDLICDRLNTIPHVLIMAARYEAGRRRAEIGVLFGQFANNGLAENDLGKGRDRVLGNRPVAPFLPEIGAPVRSEAAGIGELAPHPTMPAAVKYKLAGT